MEKILKVLGLIVGAIVVIAAFSFLGGWIVMLLWNWLIPVIFGLTALTFWQAWGLTFLCGLLFKSNSNTVKND